MNTPRDPADLDGRAGIDHVEPPPVELEGPSRYLGLAGLVGFFALIGVFFGPGVLGVVLAILVSIILHELGHFVAAKRSGMKVTEFFIGFGPRIWSIRRGETEYGVKAVWVGAYVKVIGMNNLDPVEPGDEAASYRSASYPRRVFMAFAGPGMNLLFALVLLFGFSLFVGEPQLDPTATGFPEVWVSPDSAAAQAGVLEGDTLIAVAGLPVPDFDTLGSVVSPRPFEEVDVEIERDGERVVLPSTLGARIAGISGSEWPVIHVAMYSSGSEAHLGSGDEIVEVDGGPVPDDFETFANLLLAAGSAPGGSPIDLVVARDGLVYKATLSVPEGILAEGHLGVAPGDVHLEPMSPVSAVSNGPVALGSMVSTSVSALFTFFSPSGLTGFADQVVSTPIVDEAATGPTVDEAVEGTVEESALPDLPTPTYLDTEGDDRVLSILGIVQLGSGLSLAMLMFLMAWVNVFLAVFNLAPLLPFDGGHIAVATYERIRELLARFGVVGGHLTEGRYFTDFTKLLPVTYVVVTLILLVGVGALYLDAIDPASVG